MWLTITISGFDDLVKNCEDGVCSWIGMSVFRIAVRKEVGIAMKAT